MSMINQAQEGSQATVEQMTIEGCEPKAAPASPVSSEEEETKQLRKKFKETCGNTNTGLAVKAFFGMFSIVSVLAVCGIVKIHGISASQMLMFLINSIFAPYSIFRMEQMHLLPDGISTSGVSRFLGNPKFNWEKLLARVGGCAAVWIASLSDSSVHKILAVDDSDYDRHCRNSNPREGMGKPNKKHKKHRKHKGSRTELVGKKYDHARKRHSWGFRKLTLVFADSMSCIPLAFTLLTNSDNSKLKGDRKTDELDHRTRAYKRRKWAQLPAVEALLMMAKRVIPFIPKVKYLCADRWFSDPATVIRMRKGTGLHVITVLKHGKTKYLFEGKLLEIKGIFRLIKKRPGNARILSSIIVTVPGKGEFQGQDFQAKIVFVRNRANRKEWIAIMSTDTTLSDEDVIQHYTLRWKIECYFFSVKTFLGLTNECHAISYDAIVAHTTIVALRYIMLSVEQRKAADQRTLGELVAMFTEQIRNVDIADALAIMADALFNAVEGVLHPTDEQMSKIIEAFYSQLPERIRKLLDLAKAKIRRLADSDAVPELCDAS